MNIRELGLAVSEHRAALGLSQDQLARFSGLSRVTINELERGSLPEIGVTKLASVFSVLGLDFGLSTGKAKKKALAVAAVTASVSFKKSISPGALLKAFVSGAYPPDFLPHIGTLLDEAPMQVIVPAVREAAQKSGVAPKKIWKHLRDWAIEIKSPREVWQ